MVTPFDSSGALDLSAAADLARWLVSQGNEGLVVAVQTKDTLVTGQLSFVERLSSS